MRVGVDHASSPYHSGPYASKAGQWLQISHSRTFASLWLAAAPVDSLCMVCDISRIKAPFPKNQGSWSSG